MTRPEPATIAKQLLERVNALAAPGILVDATDEEYVDILRQASQLAKADETAADTVRGALYALTGNIELARASFVRASRSGIHDVVLNEGQAMVNLGAFSLAQTLFRKHGDPTRGHFKAWSPIGLGSGAFQTLNLYNGKAVNDLKMTTAFSVTALDQLASSMAAFDLSEQRVGELLDLVGEVLREERIIGGHAQPDIDVSTEDGSIGVTFSVPVSIAHASAMNFSLATKVVETFDEIPNGYVARFRGRV